MTKKEIRLSRETKRDLENLAINRIYAVDKRGGLDTRMDGSDYIETSVASIRALLEAAYKLGLKDGAKAAEPKRYRLEDLTGAAYEEAVRIAAEEINEACNIPKQYELVPENPKAVEDAARDQDLWFDANGKMVY